MGDEVVEHLGDGPLPSAVGVVYFVSRNAAEEGDEVSAGSRQNILQTCTGGSHTGVMGDVAVVFRRGGCFEKT